MLLHQWVAKISTGLIDLYYTLLMIHIINTENKQSNVIVCIKSRIWKVLTVYKILPDNYMASFESLKNPVR